MRHIAWAGAAAAVAVLLSGCPSVGHDPDQATSPERQQTIAAAPAASSPKPEPAPHQRVAGPAPGADPADEPDSQPRKPPDLGPPLVDNPSELKKLDPEQPVWIDPKQKQVVIVGEVCQPQYLLEFFATLRDRGYESVVVVDVRPSIVHAALLALGAKPGRTAQFNPEYLPPSGTEIAIEVRWKDRSGKRHRARAQDWIRNQQTKKAMEGNWVFAGSGFWTDESTGQQHYQADGGDFICVLNLPTAMLDLPIHSSSALESRLFGAYAERIPAAGTPVTMLLRPILEKGKQKQAPPK